MKRMMSLILICLFLTPVCALADRANCCNMSGIDACGSVANFQYANGSPALSCCMNAEDCGFFSCCDEGFCQCRDCRCTSGCAVNEPVCPSETPEVKPTAKPTAAPEQRPTSGPAAQPTAEPTQAPSGSVSSDLASQVIAQVNAERAARGLNSLKADADLTAAACIRAQEIVEKFSHTRPDGSSWSSVSAKAYGENIAMGYRTADAVMTGWMSSEGHRENILRSSFGSIGVCAYAVDGVVYWVQLFGR